MPLIFHQAAWLVLARALAISVGVGCLYLSLFVYYDERGRIENRLVDAWVAIVQRGESAATLSSRFVAGSSVLCDHFLSWLFGRRLFSLRVVLTSLAFSLSSLTLVFPVFWGRPWQGGRASSIAFAILLGLSGVLQAVGGRYRRAAILIGLTSAVFCVGSWLGFRGWDDVHPWQNAKVLLFILPVGVMSDVAFSVAVRRLLRWASAHTSSSYILATAVLNLVLGVFFAAPAVLVVVSGGSLEAVLRGLHQSGAEVGFWLYMLCTFTNLFLGIIAALLLTSLAIVLLNRLVWSPVARLIHLVVDTRLLEKRKTLAAAGLALIGASLPGIQPLFAEIKSIFF
jgi:hypothetical protein